VTVVIGLRASAFSLPIQFHLARWERFLGAAPDVRVVAFAPCVAALDSEEAAAANPAALSLPAAA
jgi:hypothetical protein